MPEVPEELLKTVLFVGTRGKHDIQYHGTAFYVTSPPAWNPEADPPEPIPHNYPSDAGRSGWLITARHIIDGIKRKERPVLLIANAVDGGRVEPPPEIPASEWIRLPDDPATGHLVDVAILPFACPEEFDMEPIPIEMFATRSRIAHASIGPGHDVVYPSLYSARSGTHRNVPLLRTGTIAAMADPQETIEVKGQNAVAYIVEGRSYAAVSGSPVFAALPPARPIRDENTRGTVIRLSTGSEFFLLGLMISHFGLTNVQDDRELLNVGLGVVLDNSYVIEGIRMAIKDGKAASHEKDIEEGVFTLDSTTPDDDREAYRQGIIPTGNTSG